VLQFTGIIRITTDSPKIVTSLYYEAHPIFAHERIDQIVKDAKAEFNVNFVSCVYRIGLLDVGDVAIVVTVAGAHREETFLANRYVVDRVKYEAAIWKKEIFEDGSEQWGKNSGKKPSFIKE